MYKGKFQSKEHKIGSYYYLNERPRPLLKRRNISLLLCKIQSLIHCGIKVLKFLCVKTTQGLASLVLHSHSKFCEVQFLVKKYILKNHTVPFIHQPWIFMYMTGQPSMPVLLLLFLCGARVSRRRRRWRPWRRARAHKPAHAHAAAVFKRGNYAEATAAVTAKRRRW